MTFQHITVIWGMGNPANTTAQQRRYNVAATSGCCSDVITTFLRRYVFAGKNLVISTLRQLGLCSRNVKTVLNMHNSENPPKM